jgi:hypothetical protein
MSDVRCSIKSSVALGVLHYGFHSLHVFQNVVPSEHGDRAVVLSAAACCC